jgi:hypothetical protein
VTAAGRRTGLALMGTDIVDIVALGFAPGLLQGLPCLALAGAADMVSDVFRGTIWNETIPNALRGLLCLAGVVATGFALPRFWAYCSTLDPQPS